MIYALLGLDILRNDRAASKCIEHFSCVKARYREIVVIKCSVAVASALTLNAWTAS